MKELVTFRRRGTTTTEPCRSCKIIKNVVLTFTFSDLKQFVISLSQYRQKVGFSSLYVQDRYHVVDGCFCPVSPPKEPETRRQVDDY